MPKIEKRLNDVLKHGGDLTHASAHVLKPLLQQARILSRQYDAVVANPPYMGGKWMNREIKDMARQCYPHCVADLFAMFIERGFQLAKPFGHNAMVTMQSWMFLASYEDMRRDILETKTILAMAHLGPRAFSSISGEVVTVSAFACLNSPIKSYRPIFFRLIDGDEAVKQNKLLTRMNAFSSTLQADFASVPGSPLVYWISTNVRRVFSEGVSLGEIAGVKVGLQTGNNDRFVRFWHEVSLDKLFLIAANRQEAMKSGKRWFPYNKGGEFRRWYGNVDNVVNWENDGHAIRNYLNAAGNAGSRPQNMDSYFCEAASWSKVTTGKFALRYIPSGAIFDVAGCSIITGQHSITLMALSLLNSAVVDATLGEIAPTMNYEVGQVSSMPLITNWSSHLEPAAVLANQCIAIAKADWDNAENSWEFGVDPLRGVGTVTLSSAWEQWQADATDARAMLAKLERQNSEYWINAYALQDELSPEVSDDQITLYQPDREEDIKRLLSYAIGCMMGRYSLDKPGLIYAHSGNQDFDPSQYKTFRADDDGIIPLLETDWGIRDDAANRIVEFIGVAWPKEHLEENLKFIADSLGPTSNEQPRDTIRRYLATGFYKHHLSMYKKRPIYWLFSSGKQRAFQCLVYLHRYHEGTLARMRTEYVIPLQGQIAARIEQLEGDKAKATSTSHRNKLQKEQDDLKKQQAELFTFEEKLKHAADQKISLDLDDGVKVNYGKFGDLLAEAKAITGGKGRRMNAADFLTVDQIARSIRLVVLSRFASSNWNLENKQSGRLQVR